MRIDKGLTIAAALLLAGSLANSAQAADYACTGVAATDDVGIAGCLAAAGVGGTCTLAGTCETATGAIMNLVGQTLQGPATLHRTNGAAIRLMNASGSTIQNLNISTVGGFGHGVTNDRFSGAAPLFQPDDITIRNTTMTVSRRCVSQYNVIGPPANDVDRETGAVTGYATGWVIEGNTCEVVGSEPGILFSGSNNLIANNHIMGHGTGIQAQQNHNASVPLPIAFGAAPALDNNVVVHNVIELTSQVGLSTLYAIGMLELGYDYFTVVPEGPSSRGYGNVWSHNCVSATDPNAAYGFTVGAQLQLTRGATYSKNNFGLADDTAGYAGNAGLVSFDMTTTSFSKNDFAGAGDYGLLSLQGTEFGNTLADNKFDAPVLGINLLAFDFSVGPNVYSGNKYCTGDLTLGGGAVDGGGNLSGHFCSQSELSPAHDCSLGLGYAGAKAMSGAKALSGGSRPAVRLDRLQAQHLLDEGLTDEAVVVDPGTTPVAVRRGPTERRAR